MRLPLLALLLAACGPQDLHPGVGDRCDGRRGDAWFEPDEGEVWEFQNTEGRRNIDEPGTIYLCPGEFNLRFNLETEGVTVRGAGPQHTTVGCNFIPAEPVSYSISGMTVRAEECGTGLLLHGGDHHYALDDVHFAVSEGTALYNNAHLEGRRLHFSQSNGFGAFASFGPTVLEDTVFEANPGAAIHVGSSSLSLIGGSVVGNGGEGVDAAVSVAERANVLLDVQGTRFGDNHPADVVFMANGTTWDAGERTSFRCDAEGCE